MRRVLFVDDERQVLDALRALMRRKRGEWEMLFVEGGEQAIAELDRQPFDVIVSDMKMPGIDGAALLKHVQEHHARVVRIVHSGYAELEAALRAVPVAHQFITKPCDADVLENVVDRACQLQSLIHDDAVREFIGGIQTLPSLPGVYLELSRVLADERASVEDVARVVERDPSMCAKVLQLVNSAFVGLGRPMTGIEMAVSYLGMNMLKNLALVVKVFNPPAGSHASGAMLDRLSRHSLQVGSIGRQLAGSDRRLADDAFIAGVLHDVGKLILASERPADFERLTARAITESRPLFEVEREELGVTHAELGAYLLGIWGLPYPIVEAAANHHAPGRVPPRGGLDALATTYLANTIAHAQDSGRADAFACAPIDEDYLRSVGVDQLLPDWRESMNSPGQDSESEAPRLRAA